MGHVYHTDSFYWISGWAAGWTKPKEPQLQQVSLAALSEEQKQLSMVSKNEEMESTLLSIQGHAQRRGDRQDASEEVVSFIVTARTDIVYLIWPPKDGCCCNKCPVLCVLLLKNVFGLWADFGLCLVSSWTEPCQELLYHSNVAELIVWNILEPLQVWIKAFILTVGCVCGGEYRSTSSIPIKALNP